MANKVLISLNRNIYDRVSLCAVRFSEEEDDAVATAIYKAMSGAKDVGDHKAFRLDVKYLDRFQSMVAGTADW